MVWHKVNLDLNAIKSIVDLWLPLRQVKKFSGSSGKEAWRLSCLQKESNLFGGQLKSPATTRSSLGFVLCLCFIRVDESSKAACA
jgi:hypothetical protein